MQVRLAISHALAQATKLSVYEARVVDLVEETRHLPQALAAHGRIRLSSRKLAMLIGKVFLQSSTVNLLSRVLDTPDYFWSAPDSLQALYDRACEYLELERRIGRVNARFQVLQEMLDVLRDQQNNMHGAQLEIVIIGLLIIDCVFLLMQALSLIGGLFPDQARSAAASAAASAHASAHASLHASVHKRGANPSAPAWPMLAQAALPDQGGAPTPAALYSALEVAAAKIRAAEDGQTRRVARHSHRPTSAQTLSPAGHTLRGTSSHNSLLSLVPSPADDLSTALALGGNPPNPRSPAAAPSSNPQAHAGGALTYPSLVTIVEQPVNVQAQLNDALQALVALAPPVVPSRQASRSIASRAGTQELAASRQASRDIASRTDTQELPASRQGSTSRLNPPPEAPDPGNSQTHGVVAEGVSSAPSTASHPQAVAGRPQGHGNSSSAPQSTAPEPLPLAGATPAVASPVGDAASVGGSGSDQPQVSGPVTESFGSHLVHHPPSGPVALLPATATAAADPVAAGVAGEVAATAGSPAKSIGGGLGVSAPLGRPMTSSGQKLLVRQLTPHSSVAAGGRSSGGKRTRRHSFDHGSSSGNNLLSLVEQSITAGADTVMRMFTRARVAHHESTDPGSCTPSSATTSSRPSSHNPQRERHSAPKTLGKVGQNVSDRSSLSMRDRISLGSWAAAWRTSRQPATACSAAAPAAAAGAAPPGLAAPEAARGPARTRVTVPVVLGVTRPSEGGWLLGMPALTGAGSAASRPGSSCDNAEAAQEPRGTHGPTDDNSSNVHFGGDAKTLPAGGGGGGGGGSSSCGAETALLDHAASDGRAGSKCGGGLGGRSSSSHDLPATSHLVSRAQLKILERVPTPKRSTWKARRHSIAIMQEVALHDELRQLSVGFAEGHDSMAAAAAWGDGADGVEDEGEGGVQRVSAVKARILARQLTPLHSSNARARRASGLAKAGEVPLAA
ncbi:MAG: hypothetical protein WDW38_001296 [Sanguina aurantia]